MLKEDFDKHLKAINFSRKEFANLTGIKYTTVTKWNNTDRPVPPWVESWLQNYIKAKDIDKVAQTMKPYIKCDD